MRPWAWALGASFALHVCAAGLLSSPPEAPAARPPRTEVVPAEAIFTRVWLAPDPPRFPPAASARSADERSPRAASKGASSAGEGAVLDSAPPAPPPGDAALTEGAPGDAASTEGVAAAGAAGEAVLTEGAAADAAPAPDLASLVHARLAAAAERCYPAAARRFQQRGTVELSFCVDGGGTATDTAVTGSSGAALLDAAARGCVVERAAPFAPEASGRCFTVPVRFGVR